MTLILTWNIQYGLGNDGRVDLARIRDESIAGQAPDAICFQEVAAGFPDLDGGRGKDQAQQIAALFPGYQMLFRPALEWMDQSPPQRFGNLILSRLPVLEVQAHTLPRPADGSVTHMQRHAMEAILLAPFGPIRLVTTHLEYYSAHQRAAQAQRLRDLQADWEANAAAPPKAGRNTYASRRQPAGTIFCGDFNFTPEDPLYALMTAAGAGRMLDAHALLSDQPHRPTCGIYDPATWPQGPHARDFFFVSPNLAGRVRRLDTDTETQASDHQPLRLLLSDD